MELSCFVASTLKPTSAFGVDDGEELDPDQLTGNGDGGPSLLPLLVQCVGFRMCLMASRGDTTQTPVVAFLFVY